MALKTKDFSVTGTSSSGGITYTYILRVTENSINKTKNTSNVTVQAILKQNYSGTAFSSWSTGVSCTINNQEIFSDYRQRKLSGTEEHIYYTWTGDLTHKSNGKLTLSVTGKLWQASPASYSPPAMTIPAGTLTLTTIPRASSVGASDANIGSNTTVVITRKDSGFTHSIAYAFGSLSGYIKADGSISSTEQKMSATTISFKLPTSFYDQIPNAAYGSCTLTVKTYSGSTLIGTAETTFRATADKSLCAPTLTADAKDSCDATKALTGDESVLVRFHSTAKCTATAQGRNGATIKTLTVNGKAMSGELDIAETETDKYVFRAVDSRGYVTEKTVTRQLIPYVKLTCNATATRVAPTSSEAVLTLAGNCWRGTFGSGENALVCRYRLPNGQWQTLDIVQEDSFAYSGSVTVTGLDYTQSYLVELEVEDQLTKLTPKTTVQRGIPVFDWGEDYFNFHVPVHFGAGATGLT